ncbi:MAG: acyl-CoA/acyl-ACP dehydrogenase, partial [Nocardioidaceae bacterium]|nr:acyl-CoA/acyl-ACP dehydrogenase [Nocardioidaceae bacterium]
MEIDMDALSAVRSVATEVLDREADAHNWSAWAAAGLTSLPVPEQYGGEGLGLAEVSVVLREAGRRAVQMPAWGTLCCGALLLASHGTDAQREALLPGIAAGEVLLAPALAGSASLANGHLTGRKYGVLFAESAHRLLVVANDGERDQVVLVDPGASGVSLLASSASSQTAQHTVVLNNVPGEVLEPEAAQRLGELAAAGLLVSAAGVLAGARDLTAAYVKERQQFGRMLAQFQAVSLQMADIYIASRTLDLAADNAVWRVDQSLPAADDLAVAGYWACEVVPPALRTCHHLHGGMGV